jgi:hypothetical protein
MLPNPEFSRNVRSQLRPSKLLTTLVIAAMLSLVVGFAMMHIAAPATGPSGWAFMLLRGLFWMQALILAAGGGIACVNAIYKEKDQNTFDYQRVTRLSPLELALGKLFGAPIFMYFLCLCFVPLVIFCAIKGRQSFSLLLAAYAVLFIGSVLVHAFALLVSMFTVRGSHTTAIIFILVALWFFSNIFTLTANYLHLGPLSPFYSAEVSVQNAWSAPSLGIDTFYSPQASVYFNSSGATDHLFGRPVPHLPVLLVVDALFVAWFLLALARNVKRDPDQYELYSPLQTFGLTVFINFILLAFVNWRANLIDVQAALLTINIVILSSLGLAQLRNRDRTRRILRTQKLASISWIDLAWPVPFLFIASLTACLMIFAAATFAHNPLIEWSPAFAIFRLLFVVAWLLRDMQFLQWMMLRRGKRPLVMGIMYLTVFYACVWIVLSAFGIFRDSDRMPFTAFFLPTPIYYLDHGAWSLRPAIWGSAFVAQWILIALFIYAQRNTIQELAHPISSEPSPVTTAQVL